MSRLRFCLLIAVLYSCSELGHSDGITTEKPVTMLVDHVITGHQEAATSESTVAPDITTTSNPKPNTTTTTPDTTTTTTTVKPTTKTTTPDTTTPKPTTTTLVPPTPTPAPTPLPPPTQGNWSYMDPKTNVTCMMVQFAAQLNVTYNKIVNNSTYLWSVLINVPATALSSGNCSGDQWLTLSWPARDNSTEPNTMTLVYHANDTNKNYGLKSLNVTLTPDNFVNGSSTGPIVLWHGPEWQTPLATSYRCKMPTELKMTSESANVAATLTLSRLQEEAYRTAPGKVFSAARECSGGDVPDAVPIAVGCALGGLVVVVLVAYLVGRRRSAARGYLSM